MKYIKNLKSFYEKKSSLPSVEDFEEIADSLYHIFDKYNIPFKNEEESQEYDDDFNPYWEYSYTIKGEMCQINIVNLPFKGKSKTTFESILDEVRNSLIPIKGRTGFDFDITIDTDNDINKKHICIISTTYFNR